MSPFSWWFLRDWPPSYRPDCLIGLSYALNVGGSPTPMTRAVLDRLVSLEHLYPAAIIILSTGDNQHQGFTNAVKMKHYLINKGIRTNKIYEEGLSSNTHENLLFTKEMLNRLKLKKPILVTYNFHTRRSVAMAKKVGLATPFVSAATNLTSVGQRKPWQFNHLTIFLYELSSYAVGWLAGWI